jgi:hypothetical protein
VFFVKKNILPNPLTRFGVYAGKLPLMAPLLKKYIVLFSISLLIIFGACKKEANNGSFQNSNKDRLSIQNRRLEVNQLVVIFDSTAVPLDSNSASPAGKYYKWVILPNTCDSIGEQFTAWTLISFRCPGTYEATAIIYIP